MKTSGGASRSKGPLPMVTWRCTRVCNNSCLYCSFGSGPSIPEGIGTEGAMRIVDQIYDFGASWFGISGGEPLLRKDIFEVIFGTDLKVGDRLKFHVWRDDSNYELTLLLTSIKE